MRHSGDWTGPTRLSRADLIERLGSAIARLDVAQIRQEVDRYVKDKSSLDLWSQEFFLQIVEQLVPV
jgi:hypothetical protein